MGTKNIRLSAYLLIVFCFSQALFAASPTKGVHNNMKLLKGKWALEYVYILEKDGMVHFDPDNGRIKFFTEMDVRFDTAILTNNKDTQKVKYEVEANYLGANFTSGKTIIAEWGILEDELFLEFTTDDKSNAAKKMRFLLIYKRK